MIIKRKKLKCRVIRATCVGCITTIVIAQLASYGQSFSDQQRVLTVDSLTISPPKYAVAWVPKFRQMDVYKLERSWSGFIDLKINFGLDRVAYYYSEIELDSDALPESFAETIRYRAGWPFKCLYWDHSTAYKPYPAINIVGPYLGYDKEQTEQLTTVSGFRAGLNFTSNDRATRRFPVAPFWIGLIANTLFWSTCWILPGISWRTVRTARRKRRGFCLTCGYAAEDLEVCPECGLAHAASSD